MLSYLLRVYATEVCGVVGSANYSSSTNNFHFGTILQLDVNIGSAQLVCISHNFLLQEVRAGHSADAADLVPRADRSAARRHLSGR